MGMEWGLLGFSWELTLPILKTDSGKIFLELLVLQSPFCIKIRRVFNSWLNEKSFRWLCHGSNVTLYLFLIWLIFGANLMLTHFVPFNSYIPLEKSENLCCCDVFRRYRKRPLTWNWLICFFSSGVSYFFLVLDFWSFFHEKSGDFRESYQIFLGVGNNVHPVRDYESKYQEVSYYCFVIILEPLFKL